VTDARDERNRALLDWYDERRRDLPWRGEPDPYVTLVSEAMLQQTQVDRVIPKFEAWMERWPTVDALAAATNDEVLAAWSGLGYNSRAIRLRDAAAAVDASGWPDSISGLRDLPGVGPYTAAAIASIAMAADVPAVDTNLKRVLGRWHGATLSGVHLADYAADVVGSPAGDWNQAMMDLGATTCRPRNPRCDDCPVEPWCADPTVYSAPPKQSTFEGSNRQLRGVMVRAHLDGRDPVAAGRALDRSDDEIETTMQALRTEGLLG
jgi:A/G-specific adenine glycosylase